MAHRETDIDRSELTDEEAADFARIEEESFMEAATGEPSPTADDKSDQDNQNQNAGNADVADKDDDLANDESDDNNSDDDQDDENHDDDQDNDQDDDDEQGSDDKTPDLAEQVGIMLDRLERIEKRQFKNDGSIGGMAQKLNTFMERIEQNREKNGDDDKGPSRAQVAAALKDSDKFKALAEEWPEISDVLLEISEQVGGHSDFDPVKFKEELQSESSKELQSAYARIEELTLHVKAPGWEEEMDSPEFARFCQDKLGDDEDGEFRKLVDSPKASDALVVLKQFREHKKSLAGDKTSVNQKPNNSRQERLGRNLQRTSGRSNGAPAAKDADEYLEEGFNEVRGR